MFEWRIGEEEVVAVLRTASWTLAFSDHPLA
jgi:hypothetical protein